MRNAFDFVDGVIMTCLAEKKLTIAEILLKAGFQIARMEAVVGR